MAKNSDAARQAAELTRAQDSMRFVNEELIKLSQRFGRMIPRLQKLDGNTIGVLSWFAQYNRLKDCANRADEDLRPLMSSEEVLANPVMTSMLSYYSSQRSRYCFTRQNSQRVAFVDDLVQRILDDAVRSLLDETGDQLPHNGFPDDDFHGEPFRVVQPGHCG